MTRIARPVLLIALLYLAPALMPPSAFETPLYLMRLAVAPAPERIAVPVDHVTTGALRDGWGGPRPGGRRHEGIDIFAPRGTRVLASTDGVVLDVGTDVLGGLVVRVLGPGRQVHYYAHLERHAALRPGDRVSVGDTLGYVGTTGNARGGPPHLHYGIYTDRGAIDPYPLLAPRQRPQADGCRAANRAPSPSACPRGSPAAR